MTRLSWAVLGLLLVACAAPSNPASPPATPQAAASIEPATSPATSSPAPAPSRFTPRPTIDPRATVGPSDDFVLPNIDLRIASSAMAAPVGGKIRLSAQNYSNGMKVSGKVGWSIDSATRLNAYVIDGTTGELGSPGDVVIVAPGPVLVHAKYGDRHAEILLAGTSSQALLEGLAMPALGFNSWGRNSGRYPALQGVYVITTPADWARFLDALAVAPKERPVPPVDLASASLVVLAAAYGYYHAPPVITRVEATPPGFVEVVQTWQASLAPPPASAIYHWQLFQVAKLPAGAQVHVHCSASDRCDIGPR